MAVSVSTEIDAKTLGDLGHVIDRLQKETGRSTDDAVTFAALKIAESGRAASKLGKKNRTILVNPTWEEAKRSSSSARRKVRRSEKTGKPANLTHDEKVSLARYQKEAPFFIVRRRQNKGPALLPAWDRKDDRRVIEARGLAKKTWNVMVGKLGALKGDKRPKTVSGADFRVAKYFETLGSEEKTIAVRLVNKLSYLEKAYPGITGLAVQKGVDGLHHRLDNKIALATKKANAGR
jgi:hypothetical protein